VLTQAGCTEIVSLQQHVTELGVLNPASLFTGCERTSCPSLLPIGKFLADVTQEFEIRVPLQSNRIVSTTEPRLLPVNPVFAVERRGSVHLCRDNRPTLFFQLIGRQPIAFLTLCHFGSPIIPGRTARTKRDSGNGRLVGNRRNIMSCINRVRAKTRPRRIETDVDRLRPLRRVN